MDKTITLAASQIAGAQAFLVIAIIFLALFAVFDSWLLGKKGKRRQ